MFGRGVADEAEKIAKLGPLITATIEYARNEQPEGESPAVPGSSNQELRDTIHDSARTLAEGICAVVGHAIYKK